MNETQHDWLEGTPFSNGIWLDMLIDGELAHEQRVAFIQHVRETDDWQSVATRFLDEKVLATTVRFNEEMSQPATVAHPGTNRKWLTLSAMVACVIGGLLIGWMIPQSTTDQGVARTPGPSARNSLAAAVAESPDTSSRGTLPGLFQVRDTPTEAVYYADFSMPQFMLDALVIAGHNVTFDQEFLGYTESPESRSAVPINVVRIQKYGQLLASASTEIPQNQ